MDPADKYKSRSHRQRAAHVAADGTNAAFDEARAIVNLERIAKSASGFVLSKRFNKMQRGSILLLLQRGEIEEFASTFGNAFRLTKKAKAKKAENKDAKQQ